MPPEFGSSRFSDDLLCSLSFAHGRLGRGSPARMLAYWVAKGSMPNCRELNLQHLCVLMPSARCSAYEWIGRQMQELGHAQIGTGDEVLAHPRAAGLASCSSPLAAT